MELLSSGTAFDWQAMLAGTVLSGLTAYACIYFFLAFIQRIGMQPFVAYRLALGIILLLIYF